MTIIEQVDQLVLAAMADNAVLNLDYPTTMLAVLRKDPELAIGIIGRERFLNERGVRKDFEPPPTAVRQLADIALEIALDRGLPYVEAFVAAIDEDQFIRFAYSRTLDEL